MNEGHGRGGAPLRPTAEQALGGSRPLSVTKPLRSNPVSQFFESMFRICYIRFSHLNPQCHPRLKYRRDLGIQPPGVNSPQKWIPEGSARNRRPPVHQQYWDNGSEAGALPVPGFFFISPCFGTRGPPSSIINLLAGRVVEKNPAPAPTPAKVAPTQPLSPPHTGHRPSLRVESAPLFLQIIASFSLKSFIQLILPTHMVRCTFIIESSIGKCTFYSVRFWLQPGLF